MKIKTYEVYSYDESSEEQKEKVLNNLCDINLGYAWWDFTYDDAKTMGLEITSFDIYRHDIDGHLLEPVGEVCRRIISNHGKECGTYKLAQKYFVEAYLNGNESDKDDFTRDLLQGYLFILRRECDFLGSRKAIEETIRLNEYEFTSDGKID